MKLEKSSSSKLSVKDFLFLLLIQFPEIFTINYNLMEDQFKLTFLIKKSGKRYIEFVKKFRDIIKAYRTMPEGKIYSLKITLSNVNSWKLLQIAWKKEDITFEDVNLIIELVIKEFSQEIIIENRNNSFEDVNYHRDFTLTPSQNLFAYREAGKVYVLHK